MKYKFSENDIESTNFDSRFDSCFFDTTTNAEQKREFFGKSGKEHYRMLSYLSTLFNYVNIIDIGTHQGSSALALSYNKNNQVYSFDIVDNVVNHSIKQQDNIRFFMDNLFDTVVRENWKQIILNCPFIFLDSHNGTMEIAFFEYLQEIEYPGFVICDDIWYFKEMRDKFWYKIPETYRYDLTHLGHWSGTGIFTFNANITFPKYDNSNWTLVTAYFDLTKYDASRELIERDKTYYLSHAISTLSLPYNLVIYCEPDGVEEIKRLRPADLMHKTRFVVCNFDDFRYTSDSTEDFHNYRQRIVENRKNNPYYFDNRNTASYYLFCMARYIMLKETIVSNPFQSSHFAWINFCIERMGYKNLVNLDEALSQKRNRFSTCYIDYIPQTLIDDEADYFKYGRCSMCSGFFTGNAYYMYEVCNLIEKKFVEYLEKGYGHADEQLYSPVYFENPHLFEHYYGDYTEMITNYTYIYEKPDAPIYNFIKNSFNHNNFEKCKEACEYLMKSIFMKKCELDEQLFDVVFYYYRESKKMLA